MKIKQTIKQLIPALVLAMGFLTLVSPLPVSAAECGGVETSIIGCEEKGALCPDGTQIKEEATCPDGTTPVVSVENTGAWGILLVAINILTAGVGVVAIAGIVYASILYTSAGGSAEQIKKSMTIIADIVIGVLAFALMYAILNFIIPGGLFA
jgi:hypothetical protein